MEILYWWIFSLVLFFGLGWITARIDIRDVLREAKSLPRAFARSYRHLAAAEPEKAIEPFVDFHFPANASFDLILSLGVLYRRQGQFLEAIRLHEELHQRVDLDDNEHEEVTWELANDYLKAGILDRAILCVQALRSPAMQERATLTMLDIFQIEKQWDKALEYAAKATLQYSVDRSLEVSHFHCELAARAFQNLDMNTAYHHLNTANKEHPRNLRVAIMRGDFALSNKEFELAISHFKKAIDLDHRFLIQIIPRLHEAFTSQNLLQEEERLLFSYLETYPSGALLYEISKILGDRLTTEKLFFWLKQYESTLKSWQTLHVIIQSITKNNNEFIDNEFSDNKTSFLSLLSVIRPQHYGYICEQCGFLLQNHVWRCPGCGEWEKYSPIPQTAA